MHPEWKRGEFTISTDPERLDIDRIHEFLSKEASGRWAGRAKWWSVPSAIP